MDESEMMSDCSRKKRTATTYSPPPIWGSLWA